MSEETSERLPCNAFEMMVWERLFVAILTRPNIDPSEAKQITDHAFTEYKDRHDGMMVVWEGRKK